MEREIVKVLEIIAVAAVLCVLEMIREIHTFKVTHYTVTAPKLVGEETKFVLLSDLHNKVYGKHNKRLLYAITKQRPDAILIAGDMLVGKKGVYPKPAMEFVKSLANICPVFYANGNHEQRMKENPANYSHVYERYKKELSAEQVIFLENRSVVREWNGDLFTISGLEIPYEGYAKRKYHKVTEAEIEQRIGKARNGFMFSLEILERQYDMHTPEGKTEFYYEAAKRLAQFEEEIERNNYIDAVAEAYHIGYDSLRKLVAKAAVQSGMASPVARPRTTHAKEQQKEDGMLQSQKILLTWMIEDESLFGMIRKYIMPEDFTTELYRTVALLLYEQYEKGEVNPAKIMNHFTDEEEHREVAALFHTKIRELTTKSEQEKALKETIIRVKENSIETATRNLEPTDIVGLQRLMESKRAVQDLQKLHISIN